MRASPVGALWMTRSRTGDNAELSPELHDGGFSPVRAWGNRCVHPSATYAGAIQGCTQSTALITINSFLDTPMTRKGTL